MGDAVRFADPQRPQLGLVFDGRLAEDFKLSSGTWASVGPLRSRFIAAGAPLVQDVVVAGHDRDYLAVLVAERQQINLEDQHVQAETRRATSLAALYKALAGAP